MKKNLTLTILSLFLLSFLAKDVEPLYPFDSINEQTKIFAVSNFKDENGDKLSFLLDDPEDVRTFFKELKFGRYESFIYDDQNSIFIELIQDHKRVDLWTYNANIRAFNVEYQKSYMVDIDFFRKLHKKHPLNYRFEQKSFNSKVEFEKYNAVQIQDESFLYSEAPLFRYEGSFQIQFPNNTKYPSPKVICDYLKPLILEIEPDDKKFLISYVLDDYNLSNSDQYTMTISGSKKIFENLKLDHFEKKNWEITNESATFYYKTK